MQLARPDIQAITQKP